jgi:hypothetical protein
MPEDDPAQNFFHVDPNSMAYQNAILEDKINRHEKLKKDEEKI